MGRGWKGGGKGVEGVVTPIRTGRGKVIQFILSLTELDNLTGFRYTAEGDEESLG